MVFFFPHFLFQVKEYQSEKDNYNKTKLENIIFSYDIKQQLDNFIILFILVFSFRVLHYVLDVIKCHLECSF